jgi:amidophosphoribosyltransferase
MFDKFKDECGVFGIFGHPEAANLTYLGLYALQHRGQESAGIASSDGVQIAHRKAMGYVNEAFNAEELAKLPGNLAVGHVRIPPPVRAASSTHNQSSSTASTASSP